jgi:hypothetical protein
VEGMARVAVGGKFGYVDKTGAEIIAPQYDEADAAFKGGFANVKLAGKAMIIDLTGKEKK